VRPGLVPPPRFGRRLKGGNLPPKSPPKLRGRLGFPLLWPHGPRGWCAWPMWASARPLGPCGPSGKCGSHHGTLRNILEPSDTIPKNPELFWNPKTTFLYMKLNL
jgi:hypothetical protein